MPAAMVRFLGATAAAVASAMTPYEAAPVCDRSLCKLHLKVVEVDIPSYYGPTISNELVMTTPVTFETRGYVSECGAQGPMGPTLRTRPGEVMKLSLTNDLEDIDNPSVSHIGTTNGYMHPNSTGLHWHGFHGPDTGVSPGAVGDNVWVKLEPGMTQLYEYVVSEDHMPGLHIYHAHLHGSTTLQAGGGAVGLVIVEDPPGTLPAVVEAMPEYPLLIHLYDFYVVTALQQRWNDQLLDIEFPRADDAYIRAVVNNQVMPTIQLEAGKWARFRIAETSVKTSLFLEVAVMRDDVKVAACEMQLLAKDGIYLSDAPRRVDYLPLYNSNRADVAVKCDTAGPAQLRSVLPVTNFQDRYMDPNVCYTGPLVLLDVRPRAAGAAADPPIPALADYVKVPKYLTDTRGLSPDQVESWSMDATPLVPTLIEVIHYIGKQWEVWSGFDDPLATYYQGDLVETHISGPLVGLAGHSIHLHMSPIQLVDNPFAFDREASPTSKQFYKLENPEYYAALENFFRPGDWQDTLTETHGRYGFPFTDITILGQSNGAFAEYPQNNATFRWWPSFVGWLPLHCHTLQHEDRGMMRVVKILPRPAAAPDLALAAKATVFQTPAAFMALAILPIAFFVFRPRRQALKAAPVSSYGSVAP